MRKNTASDSAGDGISRVVPALSRVVAEAADLSVELRERKERPEISAEDAGSLPRQRRQLLDSAAVIATFSEKMDEFHKDNDYGNPSGLKRRLPGQMVEG